MRKELNFQSGTDAESSLKLDLNSVIAELTESVTKQAPKITGNHRALLGRWRSKLMIWIRQLQILKVL